MAPAAALGLVTTLAVLPAEVPAAFHAPQLHVAVETANVLVGLLVTLLVLGRYRADHRLHQLLLVDALLVLALANAALAVSAGLGESATVDALRWASVLGRLLGAALLCASALTPAARRTTRMATASAQLALASLVAVLTVALAAGRLPSPVVDAGVAADTGAPALVTHPAVVAAQVVGLVLLATAAVAFTRRALESGDGLTRWLAAGTILSAFARVHYLLYPSLLSDVVYTGDALRAGFYGCLLVGAMREIEGYWRLEARTAVLDERRRIARDLHDGMTQELTYILAEARTSSGAQRESGAMGRIEDASLRALDEARRAIEALDRDDRRAFVDELRVIAADLAGRYDVPVDVELSDEVEPEPSPEVAENLARIVAEAVRNAVRHGHAHHIRILLWSGGRMDPMAHQLTVTDDGVGFDVASPPRSGGRGGYGLVSMRDRATAIGGTLAVDSAPGRGTTVTVTW